MIHQLGRDLEAKLVAKGCPFKVVDREATKPTAWRNVIVIEETGDTFGPARSQLTNPRRYYTGNIGAKLTIYAQSMKAGALEFEHRRLARSVVDLVLVAIRTICAEWPTGLAIGVGGFTTIADLEKSERQGGAVYELEITVERGIFDTTFAGAYAAEANLTAPEMAGYPDLTFATAGTITRSAGSWVDDGFVVGMTIHITGSALNDIAGTVSAVSASVLTLGPTDLDNEGPVSNCTVSAGGVTHTTLVSQAFGPDDDDDSTTPPATAEVACGA